MNTSYLEDSQIIPVEVQICGLMSQKVVKCSVHLEPIVPAPSRKIIAVVGIYPIYQAPWH